MRAVFAGMALLASSAAWAGELREPVMELLNQLESSPEKADFDELGAGVASELLEIAQDSAVPHSRRGRALVALGHYPSDALRTWLETTLEDASDKYMQRKAASALATGFGEAAIPALSKALAADDAQLRIATAKALGQVGSKAAKDALTERAGIETESAVKDAISKSLGGAK